MLQANSWRNTCPVHLTDLRYINVNYLNFQGKTVSGEIIVHKDIAKASLKYKKRRHRVNTYADRAVLLKYDKATQIFKKYGWSWGGDWRTIKDYQHFVKK